LLAAPGADLTALVPQLRYRLGPQVQVLLLTALHTALVKTGSPYL